jgi:hypothetical protein
LDGRIPNLTLERLCQLSSATPIYYAGSKAPAEEACCKLSTLVAFLIYCFCCQMDRVKVRVPGNLPSLLEFLGHLVAWGKSEVFLLATVCTFLITILYPKVLVQI